MSGHDPVRADSTLGVLDGYKDCTDSPSSPSSPPLPTEDDPTEKLVEVEYPPRYSRSPAPPWEQGIFSQNEPAPDFVYLQQLRSVIRL